MFKEKEKTRIRREFQQALDCYYQLAFRKDSSKAGIWPQADQDTLPVILDMVMNKKKKEKKNTAKVDGARAYCGVPVPAHRDSSAFEAWVRAAASIMRSQMDPQDRREPRPKKGGRTEEEMLLGLITTRKGRHLVQSNVRGILG